MFQADVPSALTNGPPTTVPKAPVGWLPRTVPSRYCCCLTSVVAVVCTLSPALNLAVVGVVTVTIALPEALPFEPVQVRE